MTPPLRKHGKGPNHGKSTKKPAKEKRKRSWLRRQVRKDRNVARSSHGKFQSVAELTAHERRRQ